MSDDFAMTSGETPRPHAGSYTGTVIAIGEDGPDPRLEITLHAFPGEDGQRPSWWARVAMPFAGSDRGAFLLPQVDDEVLVVFANDGIDEPVVIGGLWNGRETPPEDIANHGKTWSITGAAGTRIAIEEGESPIVRLTTPGGREVVISDQDQSITLNDGSSSITIDTAGVTVDTPQQVEVTAAMKVTVTAPMIQLDAAMVKASGVVQCTTLVATTVVGSTYTPGAGNVW